MGSGVALILLFSFEVTRAEIVYQLRERPNTRAVVKQALNQDISKDLFRQILSRFARYAPEPYAQLVRAHRFLFFLFSSAGIFIYAVVSLGLAALITAKMELVVHSFLTSYLAMFLALALLFILHRRKEALLDQAEKIYLRSGFHWLDEKLQFEDYF